MFELVIVRRVSPQRPDVAHGRDDIADQALLQVHVDVREGGRHLTGVDTSDDILRHAEVTRTGLVPNEGLALANGLLQPANAEIFCRVLGRADVLILSHDYFPLPLIRSVSWR